jgi:hypothetical protein
METPFVDVYYLLNRVEIGKAQEQALKLEVVTQLAILNGANQSSKKEDKRKAYDSVRRQITNLVGETKKVLGEDAFEQALFVKNKSKR